MSDVLVLRLANRLSEIERLSVEIDGFAAEHDLHAEALFQLQLVLDELVSNVIKYAHDDGLQHEILVRVEYDHGGWSAEVRDDGKAFDPLKAPPPRLDASIEERPIGGLGIHIVLSMMDSVMYRRENGQNILTVRKNAAPA